MIMSHWVVQINSHQNLWRFFLLSSQSQLLQTMKTFETTFKAYNFWIDVGYFATAPKGTKTIKSPFTKLIRVFTNRKINLNKREPKRKTRTVYVLLREGNWDFYKYLWAERREKDYYFVSGTVDNVRGESEPRVSYAGLIKDDASSVYDFSDATAGQK